MMTQLLLLHAQRLETLLRLETLRQSPAGPLPAYSSAAPSAVHRASHASVLTNGRQRAAWHPFCRAACPVCHRLTFWLSAFLLDISYGNLTHD
jgi:hypothetical protein